MAVVPPLTAETPGGEVLPGKDHPVSRCCASIRNLTQPGLHAGASGSCFLPAQQEGRSFLLGPGHLPEPAPCHRHTLMPAQGEGGMASLGDSVNLQC